MTDTKTTGYRNTILHGDCVEMMRRMPSSIADMGLTDPPYIAGYKARDGRSLANDKNSAWLKPSFAELYRVLKPNSFCISFYGWPKTDLFMSAWKGAGFRVGGHFIFRKRYASKNAFVNYKHEAAYLLLKGNPAFPAAPLDDVREWVYTGNTFHPTQKSIHILKPLIESFTKRGQLVLDPFAGSGSTLKAAALLGRDYLGMELDATHYQTAVNRLQTLNIRRAS